MRYAFVLDQDNYKDLVHNAYIYYHKKSGGEDLFDKPEPYILKCVKFMWRWQRSNMTFNKSFVTIDRAVVEEDATRDFWRTDFRRDTSHKSSFCTADAGDQYLELESQDHIDLMYKKVASYATGKPSSLDPKVLIDTMDYFAQGYNSVEIAEIQGSSPQAVSKHKMKLRDLLRKFEKK